jgi:hypothetical protein
VVRLALVAAAALAAGFVAGFVAGSGMYVEVGPYD